MSEFVNIAPNDKPSADKLIEAIGEALLSKKAENILRLDVRNLTTLTDYFIVCHATSDSQVKALADIVIEDVKNTFGERVWRKEGHTNNRWIVLDYVNVVVHIFLRDLREYYGIERMWSDAEISEIKD